MAVEERSRRSLYDLLKEPLGMAATNALLDELPPVGNDLATRGDTNLLRAELHSEIAVVREEAREMHADLGRQIAELGTTLARQQVRLFVGMLGFVATLIVGLVVPLVTLT